VKRYRLRLRALLWGAVVVGVLLVWLSHSPPASGHRTSRPTAAGSGPRHARDRWLTGSAVPFTGAIYIADEEGNRILKVNVHKHVLWVAHVPAPDDINPMPGGPIVVNSDAHQVVYTFSPTTGKILQVYGHYDHHGASPGYLYIPEDSYGMPGGRVLITDPGNERIIMVDWRTGHVLWQYGHTGQESTRPGYLYWTNNGVPLADGTVLITDGAPANLPQQIVDVSRTGRIVWHIVLPAVIHYPSDAMPVGPGLFALTDYSDPAGLYVVNTKGHIIWSYRVTQGPGRLNYASSINRLPNGNFLVSDDHNDRVVVINPVTHRIVWQYGVTGVSGSGPDHLVGNTDAKAVGEPLPPFVPWEGYHGPVAFRRR
jgi:outer membrane protein assembly factor BamB